jgi:hypothetical protein
MLVAECLPVCLVEWVAWVAWVAWECNPPLISNKNSKRAVFTALFFTSNKNLQ